MEKQNYELAKLNKLISLLNDIDKYAMEEYPDENQKDRFIKWYRKNIFEKIYGNCQYNEIDLYLFPEIVYCIYNNMINNGNDLLKNSVKSKIIDISDGKEKNFKLYIDEISLQYDEVNNLIIYLKTLFREVQSTRHDSINSIINDLTVCIDDYFKQKNRMINHF